MCSLGEGLAMGGSETHLLCSRYCFGVGNIEVNKKKVSALMVLTFYQWYTSNRKEETLLNTQKNLCDMCDTKNKIA